MGTRRTQRQKAGTTMFGKHKRTQQAKQWQHLTDEAIHPFDQTNGVLTSLDTVQPEDTRPAERAAEGAIISGFVSGNM